LTLRLRGNKELSTYDFNCNYKTIRIKNVIEIEVEINVERNTYFKTKANKYLTKLYASSKPLKSRRI